MFKCAGSSAGHKADVLMKTCAWISSVRSSVTLSKLSPWWRQPSAPGAEVSGQAEAEG